VFLFALPDILVLLSTKRHLLSHQARMGPLIGHVAAMARYPVKSMGGEAVSEAEIGWAGIVGDRQWAFVAQGRNSRFPWFTGRDHSDLVRYRAAYEDGAAPRTSDVRVTAPDGWQGSIRDPALLRRIEEESESAVSLLQLGRGAFDAMPISIVSIGGHAQVEQAHGTAVDARRFRINLIVETDIPMRVWAGRRLQIGDADGPELAVTAPIERCVMITIDPDTGKRDPWLMRTVAQQFENHYGVYANVVRPGLMRQGDPIRLSEPSSR
jgi:uncharacterized protein YcbX